MLAERLQALSHGRGVDVEGGSLLVERGPSPAPRPFRSPDPPHKAGHCLADALARREMGVLSDEVPAAVSRFVFKSPAPLSSVETVVNLPAATIDSRRAGEACTALYRFCRLIQ